MTLIFLGMSVSFKKKKNHVNVILQNNETGKFLSARGRNLVSTGDRW